ncbi:hypothetical protein DIURU_005258 [Diutina rugosa]|uniref:D-isomer specific 2-hydroxyacid dehydrogenase NAD-binding domain-containing protein n=1 Tax=Diutina rugosa TaxID=5481 RepID=A0A642UDU6_DIURU|nr:uncharacterized protein DIURU_005258 [Diutina rugosa]KAA8897281.1 hypothetical protein DIURU_005258 [Diutina rugosa]
MASSTRPKVLRCGKTVYAHDKWDELATMADIVELESKSRDEFIKDLDNGKYDGVTNITRTFMSIKQTGRFDAELVKHFPDSVKSVSHCGAGYDQVDPEPLTERGIQLSNVTKPVEAPTADTAVFLTLSCMRNFQQGHQGMAQWPQKPFGGAPIGRCPSSKVVGILGMGGIGRAIRDRLAPFGFKRVIYHNRNRVAPELEGNAEYVSKDQLLAESDVIMISVPLNKHTRHMVNKEMMDKMKPGVILINTARGAVIDEAELINQLKSGKIASFGSDVFEHEPEVPQELIDMPQVMSLPHMGTWSIDAIKAMEEWTVDNVISYIKTGKVKTIVPEQANEKW